MIKALCALLISTMLLVGIGLGGSNTAATSKMATSEKDIVDTAVAAGDFKTLVSAVQAAGLVDTLKGPGPFTVFAPTDEAFAKIPKEQLAALLANKTQLTTVLTYHVVPGKVMSTDLKNGMMVKTVQGENITISLASGSVMVNDAKVVQANIACTNGVIHAIDTVLMPSKMATSEKDIVDTAVAAGNFKTLVSAVQAAGLVDTLKGSGPFTVFAPTDEAFAKIPKEKLAALLANKTQLTAVLTYHVVPGKVMSTDLKNGMMVKTVQGENLTISLASGSVMVNDAKVVQANIACTNGVIHAIDTVLMPS
jgi:transforming growth factor-beta-induced protein